MEYVLLNNGIKMPMLGFGTFQIRDPEVCEKSVSDAISVGYRLLDTAQAYGNEAAVGKAVKASGLPREGFFITTKIWITNAEVGKARRSLEESLKLLQTDYLDLVLIHHPYNDYYAAYREMEEAYREGLVKAIGVSNFYADRYIDLCNFVDIIPAVNQLETHIFQARKEERKLMSNFGTQPEAWGPLAEGKNDLFTHPTLMQIGEKYGKSPAQVALRYLIEDQVVVIPKSVHKERMQENIDIFDFSLSKEDHKKINALDENKNLLAHHHEADFTSLLIRVAKEREAQKNDEQ